VGTHTYTLTHTHTQVAIRRAGQQHGDAAALKLARLQQDLVVHASSRSSATRVSASEAQNIQKEVARFGSYLSSVQESVSSAKSQRNWLVLLEEFLGQTQERIGKTKAVTLALLADTAHTNAFLSKCKERSDNQLRLASQLLGRLYDMRASAAPVVSKTLVKNLKRNVSHTLRVQAKEQSRRLHATTVPEWDVTKQRLQSAVRAFLAREEPLLKKVE
jgi:hypothetical protein